MSSSGKHPNPNDDDNPAATFLQGLDQPDQRGPDATTVLGLFIHSKPALG